MMKCGLLGRKLTHSYSPLIHSMLGSYSYELFEAEPDALDVFFKDANWDGINVTVPYKKEVVPYLDELTPVAHRLGAVNTVVRRNGRLIGHNTDYFGFLSMVKSSGLYVAGKKALVLGSGGASVTVTAVLEDLGAHVVVISRKGINHYGTLDRHQDAALIVNATPVGMFPDNDSSPIDIACFPHLEGVLDLIYNPARTKLILDAERRGLIAMNGLLMLVAQAKEAAMWFTDTKIDDTCIPVIHAAVKQQMENIILIGMPGRGKSPIGRLLADKLGRNFADSDTLVEELAGMSIPSIFRDFGEDAFRDYESDALHQLGKQSGLIIATGGGCVTQDRNYQLLHQNGTVIWLQRDPSLLPTDGRPLSQLTDPVEIYRHRAPLYERFADHTVSNDAAPEQTVEDILEVLR